MPEPPVQPDPATASERVHALAEAEGFALCGIADARLTEHAEHLRHWVAAGKHGEMAYLADRLEERLDPAHLQGGAKSVIAVADYYGPQGVAPETGPAASASPRGRIARYAWGDDYHKVIKKRLHALADALNEAFPGHAFRSTVDTAPALEREHATRSGLGWIGKNTMLVHPRHGSFFLLGCVITTLELQPSEQGGWPRRTVAPTDHCGTCTRCIDACPTRCIETDPAGEGPRTLDGSRCISYLTLEHRSPIDPALHDAMGDWIAGCDVCQDVCPFNRERAANGPLPVPVRYRPRDEMVRGLPLLDVLGWSEDDRRAAFQASALKRMKLDMLKRNALIALGNALHDRPDAAAARRIEAIAADDGEAELVRITARQVLSRLEASRRP